MLVFDVPILPSERITPRHVIELWRDATRRARVRVRRKDTSAVMRAAAPVVETFSPMTREDFLDRYVTTVGGTIYVPFLVGDERAWTLEDQVIVLVHELQHVAQFRHQPLRFTWSYARNPRLRGWYEAEALLAEYLASGIIFGRTTLDQVTPTERLLPYGVPRDTCDAVEANIRTQLRTYLTRPDMSARLPYGVRIVVDAAWHVLTQNYREIRR